MEALKEKLLRSDFDQVRQHPKYQTANVRTEEGSIFKWILDVPGGKGTSWEGLVYDLEVTFSRRHPFEPPRVDFPRTHRNVSNPGHPLVDANGRLRMQKLSFDKWLPTIEASQVIGWLFHLFETEPPCVTSGNSCPFTHLSSETVLQVHTFLDAGDLGRLSQTSKHMLSLCFDEATWAKLYYRSCTSLDGLLGEKEGGACPVRVMGASGKWFWEGSREAFIRSWEMRKACSSAAFSTAKTQELHVKWELSGLLTVAAGLLHDIQNRRLGDVFPAANAGYLRHMERVLDSLTMRVASLQRLMAWPGVCRGLLSEKDEDGSLPIDVWGRPGQQRRSPSPSPSPHEKQHRVELPARVGGEPPQVLAAADGDDEMDDIGGGAAAAAAAAAASSGWATLQNAQPACGMGGLFWPTLYDLMAAKRRQRERLRECFRKFSRGQKLDVRDPSGVWMGAEVMWAPGDGGVGTLRADGCGEDGGAGAGAGAAPAAGVAGGGGIQGGGGGGGGGGPFAGSPVGGDAGMPEWRRLLQLGLMADGGRALPGSPPPALANWNPGAGATLAAVPAGGGAADAAALGAIAAAAVDQAAAPPAAAGAAAGGPAAGALVFGQGGTTPPGSNRKLVRVHYEGHKKKYDEWISVQSGRLAPFRSRTTRPLSVTMQFVEQVVNGASVSRCQRRDLLAGGSLVLGEIGS
ncbi:ubiquitin-conjugating enzyme E2W [Ectocarpus siliculosus]|uniref:Ubiquitin-conjugating enzyme E2W n=1 Tax=Ectocarpus siliculosus TaxID=2880 RepID=D7FVT1_ECTSI|nr:ubiquitin-conjugating enzyme E2W [Ectocarpus siliculosus]|eukprot:CBJ25451.1 ubiquitin-conjugating enzyme E2W [Ectocarpus siliculosus]